MMRQSIREAQIEAQEIKKKAKGQYVAQTLEYQKKFSAQSRLQQENISIIKDQYRKVTEVYKRKAAEMQERLNQETACVEKLEKRRGLELEGYGADLQNMRRKIEFY